MSLNHPHPGVTIHDEVMAPLGLALSDLSARLDVALQAEYDRLGDA